jgi:hypothetical protein
MSDRNTNKVRNVGDERSERKHIRTEIPAAVVMKCSNFWYIYLAMEYMALYPRR